MKIYMLIWVYTPCSTGAINQRFGEIHCEKYL